MPYDPPKAAAGDTYVNVLGASTARQCLDAGVLDEILVLIVPVLLGDGVRLSQPALAVPAWFSGAPVLRGMEPRSPGARHPVKVAGETNHVPSPN
nr:dihydrofolate reductase family protein [Frankia sp. Cr2]